MDIRIWAEGIDDYWEEDLTKEEVDSILEALHTGAPTFSYRTSGSVVTFRTHSVTAVAVLEQE